MKIKVKDVEIECPNDLDVVIEDGKVTLKYRPLNFGGSLSGWGQQAGYTNPNPSITGYYQGNQCVRPLTISTDGVMR